MIEEKRFDVDGPMITIDQSGLARAKSINALKSNHSPIVPT
jgi:hypothetical protein